MGTFQDGMLQDKSAAIPWYTRGLFTTNKRFQMRYCMLLSLKGQQNYQMFSSSEFDFSLVPLKFDFCQCWCSLRERIIQNLIFKLINCSECPSGQEHGITVFIQIEAGLKLKPILIQAEMIKKWLFRPKFIDCRKNFCSSSYSFKNDSIWFKTREI